MKEKTQIKDVQENDVMDVIDVNVIDLGDGEFDTHSHCRKCSLACGTEEKKRERKIKKEREKKDDC